MLADDTGALAVLTRPQGSNESLAKRLRQAGIQVSVLPLLALEPASTRAPAPDGYDLVMFVSAAAARFYFQQVRAGGRALAWPAATLACTVGPASAQALRDTGLVPGHSLIHPGPDSVAHDSEALWKLLIPRLPSIRRALIVRGQHGREWLGRQLEEAGVMVDRHAAYHRKPCVWTPEQAAGLAGQLAAASTVACLVTSVESVEALHANVRHHAAQWRQLWESVRFVTIHPRVASRLQSCFPALRATPSSVRLCAADDDAVFQAIRSTASSS